MRGTILRFDGTEGIVSSDGTQHPFHLAQWKSDKPPAPGQAVECQMVDGAIESLQLVDVVQIAHEKTQVCLGQVKDVEMRL